jgi:hypothetical protein
MEQVMSSSEMTAYEKANEELCKFEAGVLVQRKALREALKVANQNVAKAASAKVARENAKKAADEKRAVAGTK